MEGIGLTCCLICGHDFNSDLVKQELGNVGRGQVITRKTAPEWRRWTSEEKWIYHCATKWLTTILQLKIQGKLLTPPLGWEGKEDQEPLPFCGECRAQMGPLLELQRQLEEMEEKLKMGLEEIREKMEGAEEIFKGKGIYQKDQRYKRIRARTVRSFRVKRVVRIVDYGTKRKSERTSGRNRDESLEGMEEECRQDDLLTLEPPATLEEVEDAVEDVKPDVDHLNLLITRPTVNLELNDEHYDQVPTFSRKIRVQLAPAEVKDPLKVSEPESGHSDDFGGGASDRDFIADCPPPRKKVKKRFTRPIKQDEDDSSTDEEDDNDTDWNSDEQQDLQSDSESEMGSSNSDSDSSTDELLGTKKRARNLVQQDPISGIHTFRHHQYLPVAQPPNHVQCPKCPEIISCTPLCIKGHYYRNHSSRFRCNLCNLCLPSKHRLKSHNLAVHQGVPQHGKRVPCPICEKPVFPGSKAYHLWRHKSQEEKEVLLQKGDPSLLPPQLRQEHICEVCGYSAKMPSVLQKHYKKHHGPPGEEKEPQPKQLCSECGGTYAYGKLAQHVERVHGPFSKQFQCPRPDCSKTFKSLRDLHRHNERHKGNRPFKCSHCQKDFASKQGLQMHENLHLGIRPFKCTQCEKGFGEKRCLLRHIKNYHTEGVDKPKRKPGKRKKKLVEQECLPPSDLQTWALGGISEGHNFGVEPAQQNGEGVPVPDLQKIIEGHPESDYWHM